MKINGKVAATIVAAGLAVSQSATAWAGDDAGFLAQARAEIPPGWIFIGDHALLDLGYQFCDIAAPDGPYWAVLDNDNRPVNRAVAHAAHAHLCPPGG